MRRAPQHLGEVRRHGNQLVDKVRAAAEANGWTISGKNKAARVGNQLMPRPRIAIANVLAHESGDGATDEAGLIWWLYSGTAHATPYALMQNIDTAHASDTAVPAVKRAPVVVSGLLVVTAARFLAVAAVNAGASLADYTGHL